MCGRLFRPDPRAASRQQVCGGAACQRRRHALNCKEWNARESDRMRAERLRRVFRPPGRVVPRGGDPLLAIDWRAARDEIGLKTAVLVEEALRAVLGHV